MNLFTKYIVLSLLLLLSLIGLYLVGSNHFEDVATQKSFDTSLKGFPVDSTSGVILSTQDASLSMILTEDGWRSDSYLLDQAIFDDLFLALSSDSELDLVGETPVHHDTFHLGASPSGRLVLSADDNQELILLLGKSARGGRYLRVDADDFVYFSPSIPEAVVSARLSDWADLTLATIDEQLISLVEIIHLGEVILLSYEVDEGWSWNGQPERVLQRASISSLLAQLANLRASSLVLMEDRQSYSSTPELAITVEASEDSIAMKFFQGTEDWLVTVEGLAGAYILPSSMIESMIPDTSAFLYEEEDTLTSYK